MEIIYMHTQQWVHNIKEMFKVNVVTVENFQRYWKTKIRSFLKVYGYIYISIHKSNNMMTEQNMYIHMRLLCYNTILAGL